MFGSKLLSILAPLVLMMGCAHYPLPQDSTGVTTSDIVANVRCQARAAVRAALLGELDLLNGRQVTRYYTGRQLADAIRTQTIFYSDLDIKTVIDKDIKKLFSYYSTTQVGYEFTLKLTENNVQGVNANLLRAFLRRADTIGLSVTADRTRETNRAFTVQDTFLNLATGIKDACCGVEPSVQIIYPATGRLPVTDLVDTYIDLNAWANLTKVKDASFEGTQSGPAIRQMSDTITFTTRFTGKSNATIDFNPVGRGLLTSDIGFTNENYRDDYHRVIITLTTTDVVTNGKGVVVSLPDPEQRRGTTQAAIADTRLRNLQLDISEIARNTSRGAAILP